MQVIVICSGLGFVLAGSFQLKAQVANEDRTYKKYFVGSSLHVSRDFNKVNNPAFVKLNAGFRSTPKDVVHFRLKRSGYAWVIVNLFKSSSFYAPGENYPAYACILAPVAGFQRFWWKGVCMFLYALYVFEKYMDSNGKQFGNRYIKYLDFHSDF